MLLKSGKQCKMHIPLFQSSVDYSLLYFISVFYLVHLKREQNNITGIRKNRSQEANYRAKGMYMYKV